MAHPRVARLPAWTRTAGVSALLAVVAALSGARLEAQPRVPRVKHLFTLRGVSDRLPFGAIGDICFEPRFREIYLSDTDREEIWILDSEGFLLERFGPGVGLRSPKSLAALSDGRILVSHLSESGAEIIRSFNSRGRDLGVFPPLTLDPVVPAFTTGRSADVPEWAEPRFLNSVKSDRGIEFGEFSGGPERTTAEKANPDTIGRIQIGPDRLVYVVDSVRKRIVVYSPGGKFEKEIGEETTTLDRYGQDRGVSASGLAIRRDGTVLASDLTRGTIVVFGPDGKEAGTIGRRGGGNGLLSFPVDVAVDSAGQVYVVDRHRHTILVYDREGRYLYEFGGFGGRDGSFFYPTAICVDDVDRLWIADMSKRIQVFQAPQNGNGTKYLNDNGLNNDQSRRNMRERMVRR